MLRRDRTSTGNEIEARRNTISPCVRPNVNEERDAAADVDSSVDASVRAGADAHDFNAQLHELRSRELRRLPAGARTVLSGGCAGSWYFEWFNQNYPTRVERHIGVDAYAARPTALPESVEWLEGRLGNLSAVADGEIDLLFAGQVIEHMWPDDLAEFLVEAHRVLRHGGTLALDSPNRTVTEALEWTHPEHTIELTVDEIHELLELSGFTEIEIRGILVACEAESGRAFALEHDGGGEEWPWDRRVDEAANRPEESFVWWATAIRSQRGPEVSAVRQRVFELYEQARPRYLHRLRSEIGHPAFLGDEPAARADVGERGFLVRGPGFAMPRGIWTATFFVAAEPEDGVDDEEVVGWVEVVAGNDSPLVVRSLTAADVSDEPAGRPVSIQFRLEETAFNTQFRVHTTGQVPMTARLRVNLTQRTEDMNETPSEKEDVREEPALTPQSAAGPEAARGGVARRIGRAILWPLRRFFDPRFAGIAAAQNATIARQDEARAVLQDLYRLAEADMDASNEATAVLGASIANLKGQLSWLAEEVELLTQRYLTRAQEGSVEDLDERSAAFLNYSGSHRGFAAQAGLWLNPPVVIEYGRKTVEVAGTNERIIEIPYALRALAAAPASARVLDVGSAESTLALSLACLGYEVTAVDPRGYPFEHPRLRVESRGVEHLQDEAMFDAVLCLSTIEHIGVGAYGQPAAESTDRAAMRKIRELTRPGGLLVLSTPFGRAQPGAADRQYDRAGLDELLAGWEVDELLFARRTSTTEWIVETDASDEATGRVALVTARRGA
jgi:2-polyprenyl-3-methyl-5-hydroxy-6-metoxy-1,4-benzoquinol methylase